MSMSAQILLNPHMSPRRLAPRAVKRKIFVADFYIKKAYPHTTSEDFVFLLYSNFNIILLVSNTFGKRKKL